MGIKTKPIDIRRLLDRVAFQPENIVEAACENTVLFVEAIEYRRQCVLRRAEAKMTLERAKAEKDQDLRAQASANGDKITEKSIEAQIILDKSLCSINEEFSEADMLDTYSQLVIEVFRMRRDCLRMVEQLAGMEYPLLKRAEMAEQASEKMTEARKKLAKRFPQG